MVALIKRISAHYGGDDMEWLKDYAREMIMDRPRKETLMCFRELAKQTEKNRCIFTASNGYNTDHE